MLGSPVFSGPSEAPLLPFAVTHTNANDTLVCSCWQCVPTSLSFGIHEYTLPSSFVVNGVHGFWFSHLVTVSFLCGYKTMLPLLSSSQISVASSYLSTQGADQAFIP